MAEKFYETCAKQVVTIIHQHREGTKEIADAIQKLNTDRRYSEYGREELLKKLREELNTINQEKTNELKEVVQQFVNTYQINITDDEKADPQEVANVLKVIEMCGTGLTAEVLRTALEPIKGSRSTLKMIETMFRSKNDRALALEASYNPECIDLLDDYIGRTGAIIGYEDTFAEVKSALNVPLLVSAGLHGEPDYIANSGFGVITGGVNVVIQFFKNLGLTVANIALGIGNAIAALASNMMTAFHNAICSVQSWFYNLLSTALSVIEGICSALNKLPFVEFDYSGISSAADDYAAKASEAAGNKEDYQSISDAFNEGFTTFDAFQDGWASDAFNAGAAWGDGIADKVSNFSLSDLFGKTEVPDPASYADGFNDVIANSGIGDGVGSIDDNTGKIKDSLEVSEEELKYLRDIAEQEAINRFTTAEINVDMSGMQNTVNSGDDIDGFMTKLTDSVNEAVDNMTEGVHE